MSVNPLAALYGSIYGSLYFATIMSTAFYGVACMQTFFYFVNYRRDPLMMKYFVGTVWVSNTIQEVLVVVGGYKYIISEIIDPISILKGPPELVLQLLLTTLIAITTQGFFVYRIYFFNGKNIAIPLIWIPLAIYELVATFIYITKALYRANGVHVVELSNHFFMSLATSTLAVAAVVDILIALFLTFLLVRKRSNTGFTSTAHILQRLTVFAVNAGIWTATFALLSLILLHIYPSRLLYALFAFPLCSIYCNTLLANLNARTYIRGDMAMQNVDVDLFTVSTSRTSEGTRGDKSRVVSFRTSANMKCPGDEHILPVVAKEFAMVERLESECA